MLLPACTLLGKNNQVITEFVPQGNLPAPLTQATRLCFQLTPQADLITKVRLRFATYCRTNHCTLALELKGYCSVYFSAKALSDNQFTEIALPLPQACLPGQAVEIIIYSPDADDNNVVAVWCSRQLPPFVNTLGPLPSPISPRPIRVSIVIPVFNKVLYTYNCLLTLLASDPAVGTEIIIVDNASTDETASLLAQLTTCKIITNTENQGFVQACRQGAASAEGEFILFLNNDTQVMPGWLSSMLNVMDHDPSVGITGSKLIYPNGRLQEAGGIIFNDASGYNYGRLQDPTLPHFNQNRVVDYCSGASLMIRKSLWEQLGGFDLRFAPAYYEDTDLCLAARQAHSKVVYCHDSEVIHHEGITAGTDVQTGYKAYQTINRKKFRAKWWRELTHNHFPPHLPPEVAAFRWVTGRQTFRLTPQKILATHLFGQGWAPNFWSYLNIHTVDTNLKFIKSLGFNTVILLIPWVGFQTQVNPITYYEEYFTLFEQLLEKIQGHDLQVILRLGYTHDNGPDSQPEGFLRQIVIGADPFMLKAWCDYLDKLWQVAQKYPNLLGGFISWEDFFFMDLTHIPAAQRRQYATLTGYQSYLANHYSLATIGERYQQNFADYCEVPIPKFKGQGIQLFCEFWDDLLVHKIFQPSKTHFPPLTMEVRIDCDPEGKNGLHICHEKTFDLTSDTFVTAIYYSPAWGAANDGELDSADNILKRMEFLFEYLHQHTHNAIFIDQFNFIDNTPGFERNTGILPDELPKFLTKAAALLQKHTVGYALWTLYDVPANVLKNGLFERNYPSWEIHQGEIVSLDHQKAVKLNRGGSLQQRLTQANGVPLVKDKPFQLDFRARGVNHAKLQVSVWYEHQRIYEATLVLKSEQWQTFHLEEIPFSLGAELKLENQHEPVLVTDFYLYQVYQENGILDANGQAKIFYEQILSLNQRLGGQSLPPSSFGRENIHLLDEIQADLWMGKTISGAITTLIAKETYLVVRAYVPELWQTYQNTLKLILDGQSYEASSLHPGYNEIKWGPLETTGEVVFFELEADTLVSPKQYDENSQDNRQVSLQLLEFGFM